jgi:hypothetical protein
MTESERQAREMLARRYAREGWPNAAAFVRDRGGDVREQIAVELIASLIDAAVAAIWPR